MGLRMPTPYRHEKSGIFWVRIRVPADIARLGGAKEVKRSLRTRDPSEALSGFLREMTRLEKLWKAMREGTASVSHKQATAIAEGFGRMPASYEAAIQCPLPRVQS